MFKTYLLDCLAKGTDLEADCQAYMLIEELCNGIFNLSTGEKKKKIRQNWNRKGAKCWEWEKHNLKQKKFMSQASKTLIYILSISIILICFWKKFDKMIV